MYYSKKLSSRTVISLPITLSLEFRFKPNERAALHIISKYLNVR